MTLIQEAEDDTGYDKLMDRIRSKTAFCRVCGDDALREMAEMQTRITELETRLDKLKSLPVEWENEAVFLSGANDSSLDRACGTVYHECAIALKDGLT